MVQFAANHILKVMMLPLSHFKSYFMQCNVRIHMEGGLNEEVSISFLYKFLTILMIFCFVFNYV